MACLQSAHENPSSLVPKSRVVLCVDDDPDDQMLVLDAIREVDPLVKVASALNGVEALQFLHRARPDQLPCLVLMDINMPLMDGKQALVRIKDDRRFEEVPVVIFTTSASEQDRAFAEGLGARFLVKPNHYRPLRETVRELLSLS